MDTATKGRWHRGRLFKVSTVSEDDQIGFEFGRESVYSNYKQARFALRRRGRFPCRLFSYRTLLFDTPFAHEGRMLPGLPAAVTRVKELSLQVGGRRLPLPAAPLCRLRPQECILYSSQRGLLE